MVVPFTVMFEALVHTVGFHIGHLLEPIAARHEGSTEMLGFQEARDIDAGHPA